MLRYACVLCKRGYSYKNTDRWPGSTTPLLVRTTHPPTCRPSDDVPVGYGEWPCPQQSSIQHLKNHITCRRICGMLPQPESSGKNTTPCCGQVPFDVHTYGSAKNPSVHASSASRMSAPAMGSVRSPEMLGHSWYLMATGRGQNGYSTRTLYGYSGWLRCTSALYDPNTMAAAD
jgi:hypothetical protein